LHEGKSGIFLQSCKKNSNQTLLKKFQPPPHPLLEIRFRINQTLLEKIQADLTQKFLSRPWLQKVNQICLNRKTGKAVTVGN